MLFQIILFVFIAIIAYKPSKDYIVIFKRNNKSLFEPILTVVIFYVFIALLICCLEG
jgi:hypothetical protein